MTSPLDQVSFRLGTLDANVAILIQRADKQDAAMAAQTRMLNEIKTSLSPVLDDVKFMRPHVRHYAHVRKRAVWLGGILLSVGGTVGGLLGNYLVKKYGA